MSKISLKERKNLYNTIMKEFAPIVKKHIHEDFVDNDFVEENPSVKIGDTLRIIDMKGEPQYTGKVGTVEHIDSIGQIHGTWGGCALQPENDQYELVESLKINESVNSDVDVFVDTVLANLDKLTLEYLEDYNDQKVIDRNILASVYTTGEEAGSEDLLLHYEQDGSIFYMECVSGMCTGMEYEAKDNSPYELGLAAAKAINFITEWY